MWIESMTLQNYRNYDMLEAHFSPTLNIFVGQNAQGKTNFLEAIYFLALTRSHRTRSDKGARHKYIRTPEQIEQHKQHMRELHGTPVIQCTRDGEPVKIWQSISEAGEALNIDTGNIAHSARKERDTAGGYVWVYVDDYLFADALISAVIGE